MRIVIDTLTALLLLTPLVAGALLIVWATLGGEGRK